MNIGQFTIEQLSEGIFEVYDDGTIHKLEAESITSGKAEQSYAGTSQTVGIDPVLIQNGKQVILLDTGLGWGLDAKSTYTNTSNLLTNLDIFGLKPEDVTHVVLSHLHYDHAAGSTYVDESARTQITMPNANYFVQKIEWVHALKQAEQVTAPFGADYQLDELYKLHAQEQLVLITDMNYELVPGISLIQTGGHTPGHQIVRIRDGNQTGYYLGDLVPNEEHLNHYTMQKRDFDPLTAKKVKTLLLRRALKEQAALLFYHSINVKNGLLVQDSMHNYALQDYI